MRYLTIRDVVKACGGKWTGDESDLNTEVRGMVTDSRKVQPGTAFVAVKGERVDGHSFIESVLEKGASFCLSSIEKEGCKKLIVVDDTLDALRKTAAYYRSTFDIPVVGIIGSVGKTSTKEYVASVLSQKYSVLKTEGNFNNDIGLPLTIMSVTPQHTMAVVEMGINHFGEMRELSKIAKPDAVVFTNIAPCHLEFLGNLDGVLRAKSEVFENMALDAPVIINGDDPKLASIKAAGSRKVIDCGFDSNRDVKLLSMERAGDGSSCIMIKAMDDDIKAVVNLPGDHMVRNALLAAAAGKYFGVDNAGISKGIEDVRPIGGRSNIIINGKHRIIDDCYNANPASMRAALDMLGSFSGMKAAVLGDMGELGTDEIIYHRQIGEYASGKGVDILFCAGRLSANMADAYKEAGHGKVCHYDNTKDLKEALIKWVGENKDTELSMLVKASHSMGFSDIINGLKP